MIKSILILIATTPIIIKSIIIDRFINEYTGVRLLGASQVVANDAIIYSYILALFYSSYLPKVTYFIAAILRVAAISIFIIYITDCLTIINFHTRLTSNDIIKYASYSIKYIQQIYNKNFIAVIILITTLFLAIIAAVVFSRYKINKKSTYLYYNFSIISLVITYGFADNNRYVHSWAYINFIDYNLTILSESKSYSDEFIKTIEFKDHINCISKPPEHPNIIIIMFESLSSYQSNFFSGIRNWMPNIDNIAHNNIAFNHFYANGFSTEDAEISILTGLLPIYTPENLSPGKAASFKGFYNIKDSLPRLLKKQGYETEFLTTADLNFSNTGAWAKSLGFNYIEGHEHEYYNNWERFHFHAAPDAALYNRVLDRVQKNHAKKYFIFVKTASTHHPFIHPENKHSSEKESFQYADKQIGLFYKKLTSNGFFNNGLLVIVGDHHAMVPLKDKEIEEYGSNKAYAKVPMIVSYKNHKQSIMNDQFQQTDIFHSLIGLTSKKSCYSNWRGYIFGNNLTSPKYIAHKRGDNRNFISIFSGKQDYLIKLDGDNTEVITKQPEDPNIRHLLVNKINYVRVQDRGN